MNMSFDEWFNLLRCTKEELVFKELMRKVWNAAQRHTNASPQPNIEDLVNKFLIWELPKSVCSELCVTYSDYPGSRIGTSLLTADEARQMLEYLLLNK